MQSVGKIGYRWHGDEGERYLYLRPLVEPSDRDWVEAVKQILADYKFENIFMIIDIVDFLPVLTKTGFDDMIIYLQKNGLKKSTVGLALLGQMVPRPAHR